MKGPQHVIDQVRLDHAPAYLDLSQHGIEGSLAHPCMRIVEDPVGHPAPLPPADGRNLTSQA